MDEYYIGQYRDHYAIFDSMGRVQTQYDTHAEAKADLDSYNKTGKPLPEAASKDSVIDKAFKGPVNSMFDTTSKEFKKVGNDVGNDKKAKQTWWNDMKLTARMHKKPYPTVNGYTNGDFKPNHEWLMAAIDQCRSVIDCECLIKDGYLAISQDKQLVKNLRAVKEGNPSRYVNVKLIQKRLDNGVTPEKVEKHIEWMKENYIKGLQAKKKEFKKSQNESTNDESMNEGIFTAINIGFWGFVGICCIISGILDKKHGKEVKANLTDAEFKAIKNDTIAVAKSLIAAQKSSPFYNNIYKYNRITQDSYKDMIDNFNKGNLYSCTVRFFDAENFENYKSYYKEYGEWGNSNLNWEKLEKSVNVDMVKIIESLGFDIKTGKSSKYPNCEVRVADGEVVYVYPKAPDDILERGKKSKKKMNEDHSEISNDPEMEKLLALAGCTIEDLDTINNEEDIELDDDDPIDANTSHEIDAVMDESIGDFIRDTKNYFKNASEFLKHRKENSKSKRKDSEADIKNTPAYKEANKKLEIFGDSIGKKVAAHLKDYATKNNFKSVYKNTAFDINDIKYCPITGYDVQVSDLQDGIDYDRIPDWEEQNPGKDWQKEPQFNNDWYHELLAEGRDYAESLLEKNCPDIYAYDIGTGDGDEGLVYIDIFFTSSYINTIKEESKNSQNESAANDYHKNHEERMKNLNKKIDELNNDRKKDNEVREKQDKNATALRDLLGESTPDLDFIMESIFMDIDH